MRTLFTVIIAIVFSLASFSFETSKVSEKTEHSRLGIPSDAVFTDENDFYEIYIKEEEPAKDWIDVAKVSLWIYNKSSNKASKLLTTVKPKQFFWYMPDGDKGFDFPIDSITAIHTAIPLDSSKLIVSGVPDVRNTFSYIIDIPNRKATYLPCNGSILGFTSEEELIIGQSYRYVSDPDIAGRYTYIQIFDYDGNQVADLDLERLHIRDGVLDLYIDIDFKTKLKLQSYQADCDFKFPVDGEQGCWEYIYSFDEFAPEDIQTLDKLVSTDKNWKKTKSGYHYTFIDKQYDLNADADIDLKNKRLVFIHGTVYPESHPETSD